MSPLSDSLSLRLRHTGLAMPDAMTRGLIMQKACRNPGGPRHLVGTRFQVCFTPLTGVLFTFPSRYWYTIGRPLVFSLRRWSSRIPTRFHVSRSTQVPEPSLSLSNTGLSPSLAELSCSLLLVTRESVIPALQPRTDESARFGLFPVRSPLLGESMFLSFPAGT